MTVYVVTDGHYSDYTIYKIFSNREAAEEYKYWHNFTNDIEEYEVADTVSDELGQRYMYIRVSGKVYPEAVVDIKYDIYPQIANDYAIRNATGISRYVTSDKSFSIFNYHLIPASMWDEDRYKEKFTKALFDSAAIVKAMLADGASWDMIKSTLNEQENRSNEH